MGSPVVFISYRRDDAAGHSGRIFDRLAAHFGHEHVHRDIDCIDAGEDFVAAVHRQLGQSDVLLALIGPRWLSATDGEGRWRLADDGDLVRLEIASALERKLRVIPVLLQGAAMPKAGDLPGDLAALARRNAVEIRDASFDQDLAQLVRTLEPRVGHRIRRLLRRRPFVAAALVLVAVLAGLWAYPHLALTPDRARILIVEMKLDYDADTFVLLAGKNDSQAVALFLRAGIAPDAPNRRGETALMHAAGNGHLDLVRLLVDRGARIDRALVWSAGSGQREVLDYLLARAPSRHTLSAALVAAAGQHPDIVRKLLDLGADVDFGEEEGARTALSEASRGGNLDAVLLLLERGANPNPALREGWSPLHHAIDSRHSDGDEPQSLLDIVRALLDKGAYIEARTRSMANWRPTPLLLAIDRQLPRVTNLLIERGADIEAQTAFYGNRGQMLSPLMWASMEGSAEIVRTLLAKGANVDVRNDHGETALLVAADESPAFQAAIVESLLAAGADVRARSNRGGTALTRAAQYDNGVLPILLKAGADPNAATQAGWTALMVAAEAGETENVRRLLASGAKAELKNQDGEDAMAIAAKSDSKEIVRMLRENSMAARP